MSNMSDERTIYHVTFEDVDREEYVLAPDKQAAYVVIKRMFRAPRYDFDYSDCEIVDTGSTDIESMARGDEPPYSVLVADSYRIAEHEKRVNQGGFKGMYERYWYR